MHKPTIYEALRDKLGREPTNAECRDECRRVIADATLVPRAPRFKVQRRTFDTLADAQHYARRFLPAIVAIEHAPAKRGA